VFPFFQKTVSLDEAAILEAIRSAESRSRAEIRVHVARKIGITGTLAAAQATFNELGMHRTELRNGVLIFVCPGEKKFAILGDTGIHQHVSDAFWELVKSEMQDLMKTGKISEAICHGIYRAGEQLQQYFPAGDHNPNELSNEISRG
jgi:uncharacterized membrane protein